MLAITIIYMLHLHNAKRERHYSRKRCENNDGSRQKGRVTVCFNNSIAATVGPSAKKLHQNCQRPQWYGQTRNGTRAL